MPADEVTHGMDVDASRARTGPRHAAPKKPLFTRFHMPAGKAIALAAMPTAVLMGMGFTPTLAIADNNDVVKPTSNSLTVDEYKDCVAALDKDGKEDSESATPSPSASASEQQDQQPEPSPSATSGDSAEGDSGSGAGGSSGSTSSPDSGSDDEADPTPSPSASAGREKTSGGAGTASPSPSESGGGLLDGIGDALDGVLGGGRASESPSPTPSASESAGEDDPSGDGGVAGDVGDTVEDTTGKVTDTVRDTVGDVTGEAAEDATDAVGDAAEDAKDAVPTPTPSPSASGTTDPEDCPAATDAEGGVDNKIPLPDDPWYLDASSLLLKGADYQGIVEVRTANGTTKKVLKYVISDGTDIGDLHQTVKDEQAGKTYHVQAAKGSTSTIRDGDTVMYTESISGNLLGLIPITFSPENPPPLNIPLIYFTKVKVVQAGQFGGTLHVPGLHQYITD
ncbi:hypothetical protein [Streptomyces sp. DH24]|uniref:hypothetical protein n=1 Tax=Streptomyces sp. DH24 TaxID=3040123 RepID=UPI002441CD15|nr:hypothetical protein [Streptomyces sp. DH24]MDG9720842.1 hypothetical protein [Streptomyces sp. DH24]